MDLFRERNLKRLMRLGEGALVGLLSGMTVVLYRYLLEEASVQSIRVLALARHHVFIALGWLSFLGFLGWVVGWLVEVEPFASGSGIPHVKGVLSGKLQAVWWRIVLVKFLGGLSGVVAGLSLGREGPSVQIGAMVGQGLSEFRRRPQEKVLLVTGGASAGIAASFGAPLAGVVFALEELHREFSSSVVVASLVASVSASLIASKFFGMEPILSFSRVGFVPLPVYGVLLLFGMFLGAFGALFNRVLLGTSDVVSLWFPQKMRTVFVFLVAGFMGLFFPRILGGGHYLIVSLTQGTLSLRMLLLLCVAKFLFTALSYASGTPGGIFFPILTIGALSGVLWGGVTGEWRVLWEVPVDTFIVLGMAGYFSAITKAPITGSILITEMTGSWEGLPAILSVCLLAYVFSDLLKTRPIYDALLQRLLRRKNLSHR
ncbi:MAG: ClC family H(+)/Cl(-) exchange transporter [Candidatus Caldatribacteriaceae bacterium]